MEHKGHPAGQGHPHGHGMKPSGVKPGESKIGKIWLPRLIAWELTRSCNLDCIHCRAAARFGPYPNELTTDECVKFLDDVKSFSDPIMIITGGEPMLRDDIWDLARNGTAIRHR